MRRGEGGGILRHGRQAATEEGQDKNQHDKDGFQVKAMGCRHGGNLRMDEEEKRYPDYRINSDKFSRVCRNVIKGG